MIDLAQITQLTRPNLLQMISELKINPVVKAVLIGQIKRSDDETIQSILGKIQDVVSGARSADLVESERIKAEMETQASKFGISPAIVATMLDLIKSDAATNQKQ
jgi:hypothetical protein